MIGSGIVAGAIFFALLAAVLWLRQTVPSTSGEMALAGLSGHVEVILGPDAVPHIRASDADDAYRTLGFLHAQNRLWQMELMRRAGQGRLSEIFGDVTLARDKLVRVLDLYGHAERSIPALSPKARSALDAYAGGVNAWIGRTTGIFEPRLPPEFLILFHEPEPWRPADSIVILKMMALQLGRNFDREIDRLTFAALGLSPAEIEDLMPTVSTWGAPPLPDLRALYTLHRPVSIDDRRSEVRLQTPIDDGASNNWVVSGARSASGKPLLANDPHLRLSAPSVWYLLHIAIGPSNLVGASLPGTPLVPLGRGDNFAWGLTNTETDVQDLFIERINPGNANQYQTPDGWRDFERDTVTIRVRGRDPVAVERRRTRHGPVISSVYRGLDQILGPAQVAALQWTGLTDADTTIEAGIFDSSTRTVERAIERTRPTIGPMQSMVIGDNQGNIGLIASARVPVRDPANTMQGRAPVPGWDAKYDWTGFVPFEELPRIVNPPAGVIGTSNTRMVQPDFPHLLTWDWGPAFRQQRIEEIVYAPPRHDRASMRAAQLDVRSPALLKLASLMTAGARRAGAAEPDLLDRLAAWDGEMRAGAVEPLMMLAWVRQTQAAIWSDVLGTAANPVQSEGAVQLINILEGRSSRDWCDDARTPRRETCDEVVARALPAALRELEKRYGGDRRTWAWGRAHYADGMHEPLGRLPLIGDFFNVRVPADGGPYTINRGKSLLTTSEPYASREATTFRSLFDLADLEQSQFIQSTGQSGNPWSPFYRSFAKRWEKGEYIRIPTRIDEIDRSRIGVWRFAPTGPQ